MHFRHLTPPEEFTTERLVLRQPVPGDDKAIFEGYAQDVEVTRYLSWAPHRDIGETRRFLKLARDAWKTGTEYTWAIELKGEGTMIGMIALRLTPPRAGFGCVIARAQWKNGYATEAAREIMFWTLRQEGIRRLWSVCDVDNGASVRVLEKLGLTRERVMRRWMRPAGSAKPRDCFSYMKIRKGNMS